MTLVRILVETRMIYESWRKVTGWVPLDRDRGPGILHAPGHHHSDCK